MSKKVLIICYYWPPAGGPGVQRWLKFVKYLSDFDIEPIVYTPENPNYPIVDTSMLDEVPDSVTIIKRPIKEPYRFASMLSRKQKNKNPYLIKRLSLTLRTQLIDFKSFNGINKTCKLLPNLWK